MVQRKSFGRRRMAQAPAAPRPAPVRVTQGSDWVDDDPELEAWKRGRNGGWQMPWRQLSLMASLCFGIASFVLPDDVNGTVNWLLYGLMATSFIAGIRKKRA